MKLNPYHPLSQGLKLSLLFDEGGGNTLYDATGNMNNGTGSNHTFVSDGINLAGDNEHIEIPNFIGQDDDWTIFTKFTQHTRNPNTQSTNSLFMSMEDGGGTGRSCLGIDDMGSPTYKLTTFISGAVHHSDTAIDLNKSYTAGMTQEGTSFHFYLNGEDDGSFIATADPADGNIVLFDKKTMVGDGCFDGDVNIFHWYDRALSAQEMLWLDRDPYGMFVPDFTPAQVAYIAAGGTNYGAMLLMMMQ